jgi:hypothetical protein
MMQRAFALPQFVLGRRAALAGALAALAALPRRARALVIGGGDQRPDPLAALGPWLDTLIPADETPSATVLGVREALIDQARGQRGAAAFLESGCRWLDGEAQQRGAQSFAALDDAAREAIAAAAAAAAPDTLARRFFDNTWRLGLFHYYARPATWASLGYAGPPQPNGFPDPDRPP